jgi:hypothetical protein
MHVSEPNGPTMDQVFFLHRISLILDGIQSRLHVDGKRPHQQAEPSATAIEGRPASAVEHLMVATELWRIAKAHLSQRRGDRTPSTRSQGPHKEHLDFPTGRRAKETLKWSEHCTNLW